MKIKNRNILIPVGIYVLLFGALFLFLNHVKSVDITDYKPAKIPHKIHYVWLGKSELPEYAKQAIESWQKYAPDFEIKRWDESNCNPDDTYFTRQAYKAQNWAFVSDYCRFKALYEEGGLYLDTDQFLTAPVDYLEDKQLVLSDGLDDFFATSFIGVVPRHPLMKVMLETYNGITPIDFYFTDSPMGCCAFTSPTLLTKIVEKNYPNSYQNIGTTRPFIHPKNGNVISGSLIYEPSLFIQKEKDKPSKGEHLFKASWK